MSTTELPNLPLQEDIPCMRCGYNLRTRRPLDLCPECGEQVAPSIREFHYRSTAVTNAATITCGLTLAGLAFAFWPLQILLNFALRHIFSTFRLVMLLNLLTSTCSTLMLLVGVSFVLSSQRKSTSRLTFWTWAFLLLFCTLDISLETSGFLQFSFLTHQPLLVAALQKFTRWFGWVETLIKIAFFVTWMSYLFHFATRLRAPRLRLFTLTLLVVNTSIELLTCCIYGYLNFSSSSSLAMSHYVFLLYRCTLLSQAGLDLLLVIHALCFGYVVATFNRGLRAIRESRIDIRP